MACANDFDSAVFVLFRLTEVGGGVRKLLALFGLEICDMYDSRTREALCLSWSTHLITRVSASS